MVGVRVSLKLEASWDFFTKDRMAPEANRFNSFLRKLENAIPSGKKTNKQKNHKSLFESLSKNAWKYMKLKYLDQLRFFMIAKPLAESLAESLADG